jgi:hypothetical protein
MSALNLPGLELSWHDREQWNKAIDFLKRLFSSQPDSLSSVITKAHEIKKKTDIMDSFIQKNTSEVCPDCKKVCCINKHGYYDYEDLIYIFALGLKPPFYKTDIDDTAPCQFLSDSGCTIERSSRPFRCNWYFCNDLIAHISNGPAKPYREFSSRFQEIQSLRREMLSDFFRIVNTKFAG